MAIAKISEVKVSSSKSFDDAIQQGIIRANKTLRNVKSSWIKDFEVLVDSEGKITEYRVLMKVTFIIDD
jgi:flavin-binding protein dodecin